MLRAPVDLLWNGGIGTYVKASTETHADVGDKANDAVRIDAAELRARVVGEGGNLGFTQRGRIEFALAGGRINTDAIDNSGGVDCSDHEVNIKILLDTVVADGEMTVRQRDRLLAEMTGEVAAMVLRDNYDQTGALATARAQAGPMVDVHARYLRRLESEGGLDRAIEFLPTDEVLAQRRSAGTGLTSPEFAVLLAYTKLDVSARPAGLRRPGGSLALPGAGRLLPGAAARRAASPRPWRATRSAARSSPPGSPTSSSTGPAPASSTG